MLLKLVNKNCDGPNRLITCVHPKKPQVYRLGVDQSRELCFEFFFVETSQICAVEDSLDDLLKLEVIQVGQDNSIIKYSDKKRRQDSRKALSENTGQVLCPLFE